MKIFFEKRFLKDVESISEKTVRLQIEKLIIEIEDSNQLIDLNNVKKIKGHESAYRIRIGNYRLGFFYKQDALIFTRILHRKDIYKYFP
jgi:mRNA interferase RelE/StbE